MQEYNQNDRSKRNGRLHGNDFYKMTFQYEPKLANEGAALNFHLSRQENLISPMQLTAPESAYFQKR